MTFTSADDGGHAQIMQYTKLTKTQETEHGTWSNKKKTSKKSKPREGSARAHIALKETYPEIQQSYRAISDANREDIENAHQMTCERWETGRGKESTS